MQSKGARGGGLASPEIARRIRPGAVFEVDDSAIAFPENPERTPHPKRRCIVMQNAIWGNSKVPRTVLVVPCSSSQTKVQGCDLLVPQGMTGFDAEVVVAYTSLIQPVLKSHLKAYLGDVSPNFLDALTESMAVLLDIAEVAEEDVDLGAEPPPTPTKP